MDVMRSAQKDDVMVYAIGLESVSRRRAAAESVA